jgi:hypothetical protein
MSLLHLIEWTYQTPLSNAIRGVAWVVPAVQSLHILAIATVLGSALISDLRLAGLFAVDEPVHSVVRRYLPWSCIAVVVLLLTGLTMCIGEPDRVLVNQIFWLKMGLVLGVLLLTLGLRQPFLDPSFQPSSAWRGRHAKGLAWLSLLMWTVVVVCGRWIAYSA